MPDEQDDTKNILVTMLDLLMSWNLGYKDTKEMVPLLEAHITRARAAQEREEKTNVSNNV